MKLASGEEVSKKTRVPFTASTTMYGDRFEENDTDVPMGTHLESGLAVFVADGILMTSMVARGAEGHPGAVLGTATGLVGEAGGKSVTRTVQAEIESRLNDTVAYSAAALPGAPGRGDGDGRPDVPGCCLAAPRPKKVSVAQGRSAEPSGGRSRSCGKIPNRTEPQPIIAIASPAT